MVHTTLYLDTTNLDVPVCTYANHFTLNHHSIGLLNPLTEPHRHSRWEHSRTQEPATVVAIGMHNTFGRYCSVQWEPLKSFQHQGLSMDRIHFRASLWLYMVIKYHGLYREFGITKQTYHISSACKISAWLGCSTPPVLIWGIFLEIRVGATTGYSPHTLCYCTSSHSVKFLSWYTHICI